MPQRDRHVIPRFEHGEIMTQNDFDDLTVLKKSSTLYPDSPQKAKLENFTNKYAYRDYTIEFDCPEFTSLCPITGQPDFARISISYIPDLKCIESKSLKLYLFSFRNTGMFHEEITNKILEDLVAACEPRWARVRGVMNARGGISIEVTAEYSKSGFKR
jgi:7-cyano-7-deazaguanine reductase